MSYKREERSDSVARMITVGANCDNCDAVMEPVYVFPEGGWSGCLGALDITMEGGYAHYYDGGHLSFIFCKTCADQLLVAFPSIAKAMSPYHKWPDNISASAPPAPEGGGQ